MQGASAQPVTVKSIADVLKYATPEADSTIPFGIAIGTIISSTGNEAAGNYRLQGCYRWNNPIFLQKAVIRLGTLGDKLRVNVSGLRFSMFNGTIQIKWCE